MRSTTVAVTDARPKSCALMFDKVYCPHELCPDEVQYPWEPGAFKLPEELQIPLSFRIRPGGVMDLEVIDPVDSASIELGSFDEPERAFIAAENIMRGVSVRWIASQIFRTTGQQTLPIYDSDDAFSKDYLPGNREVVLIALQNLEIVDESKLEWTQVLEFRRDKDVVGQYRRLLHWLDASMAGKSKQFIIDEIAGKLEDYDQAIRKHGLQTRAGVLSDLLDPKLVGALSAAGAAASMHSALLALGVTGALAIGSLIVSVHKKLLESPFVRQKEAGPMALIVSARERLR